MTYRATDFPAVTDYYRTGLFASALAYLGILLLFVASMAVDGGGAQMALTMFFMGGLYAAIPAAGIAFLVTAPLGCLFGVAMRKWMEPGDWHGAVNGALTAATLLAGFAFLSASDSEDMLHPEVLIFAAGLIAVGAGAGWIAQRKVLGWPSEFKEADYEVFE